MLGILFIVSYILIGCGVHAITIYVQGDNRDPEADLALLFFRSVGWPIFLLFHVFNGIPVWLLEKRKEREYLINKGHTLYRKVEKGDEEALLQWDKLPKRIKLKVLNNLV